MICEICKRKTFPNWGNAYHVLCEECSADTEVAKAKHGKNQHSRPKNFNQRAKVDSQTNHSFPRPKVSSVETLDTKYARVLGLSGKMTYGEIKHRWRELAAQYHPDKVSHLGPRLREVAETEMKLINEAYQYFETKHSSKQ